MAWINNFYNKINTIPKKLYSGTWKGEIFLLIFFKKKRCSNHILHNKNISIGHNTFRRLDRTHCCVTFVFMWWRSSFSLGIFIKFKPFIDLQQLRYITWLNQLKKTSKRKNNNTKLKWIVPSYYNKKQK